MARSGPDVSQNLTVDMPFPTRKNIPAFLPWIVALTFFMEYLDSTILVTALPSMAESFHMGPNDLSLGVTAYTLTLAVFIPASGWAADRFGSRTIYALAVLIFTIASMLCGLSSNYFSFVAARILQGLGGAMMVPVGRFIVARNTPKPQMIKAISTITWPAIAAPVIGPSLGGFIIAASSWRWIFFLNLPLGLIGLLLVLMNVPQQRDNPRPLDLRGFFLSGLALTAILFGTELASHSGNSLLTAAILVSVGLTLFYLFVQHAHKAEQPLIDFSVMRHKTLKIAVLAGGLTRISLEAMPYLLPLLLQVGFGLSAYDAGLLLIGFAAGNLLMKAFTTRLLTRFGFRTVATTNGILAILSVLLAALPGPFTPVPLLLLILFCCGLTRSLQFTTLATLPYAETTPQEKGPASTLTSVTWQMTMGLGIAYGALLLRMVAILRGEHPPVQDFTMMDFHIAIAAAVLPLLIAIPLYARLPAERSGKAN
ncbi:MAG: MFS transporter [Acetobacter sp.]|nr:MFS transporter [Acetobacter sp.]MCH4061127.1 MFS transporter [Acetobacter sp.]MCH4088065.1 MFS transporter [Acetobacter sp.]MCI1293321.1 MFS transporter [Acetobacter sp.]MCI1320054.1 MFS transporter [Acetobacter sp.]